MVPSYGVEAAARPHSARRTAGHNLPSLGSFLGRTEEMSEVASLLGAARLVTLIGPPGIGKSRLALEVAGREASRYPDGAWLVELAPIADPAGVPGAVASVLSVPEVPGQPLTQTLAARLSRRRVLLVLDNCEHLVDACGELVRTLLDACPALSVMATSQEPLGIGAEQAWPVPPLRVPTADAPPEALMRYEAVRLFVERASDLRPEFELNPYVAPHVAEICRRLDGIALAIELAAARVTSLTPAEIAGRLDDRYNLLSKGGASQLPRHRTLAAALDWSHELLSPPERVLLRRLGVFVGGFCAEAAEAVCAGGEVAARDVPRLLSRLVSKSLIVPDAHGASPVRYRPLETIRAYASERLDEAGETAELRSAHARYYLELAERAEPQLTGLHQQQLLERLDADRQNLRSALEWSLAQGETESALRLAGALVLYWRVRCHFSEGRDLLEAVLSAANGAPAAARARAQWGAGFLALMAGDPEGALPRLEQSLAGFRAIGDVGGCARALLVLGNCKQYSGDPDVLELLEESAALAREVGDAWCLAHALAVTGFDLGSRNELPAARQLFEECLEIAREAHDKQGLRMGLIGLGSVAVRQGDHDLAESLLEEGAAVSGELGEDYSKATALQYLAQLVIGRGEYARARELLEEALAILREVGPPNAPIDTLVFLGQLAHARGDRDEARERFEEALAIGRSGGVTPNACLQGLADVAAEDDPVEARRLYEQALSAARASGDRGAAARALHGLAHLARSRGDDKRAAALHEEALRIQGQIRNVPGAAASLQAIAGLEAAAGRFERAATLIGAARSLGHSNGSAHPAWESSRYESDLALVEQRLTADQLQTALAAGAELSLDQAVAEVAQGASRRKRPPTGWASLTEAERRVAELVGEGLTNREIAERLFVAPGTVKTHLSHIFSKLNLTGRRELRREVRARDDDDHPA